MEKDIQELEKLIEEAVNTEQALSIREDELALQNKQFADYLKEKKHNDEKLEVLWEQVKSFMIENKISTHDTPFISLSLSPSGKFRPTDGTPIENISDELCDIKKSINNKKVKAFIELNGKMPEGVESTGFILRKKLKEEE